MRSISSSLEWILHSVGPKNTVQSIVSTEFERCDLTPQEKAFEDHIEGLQNDIDTEKLISALLPPPKPLPKERLLGFDRRYCAGFI
jgi:hypothetical protein